MERNIISYLTRIAKNGRIVKYIIFECHTCKCHFEKPEFYFKKNVKRCINTCCFCSRACRSSWIGKMTMPKGKDNPRWVGGKIVDSNGYQLIYMPNHHTKPKNGYIFEHRYIMEIHLGIKLKKTEIVHHVDDNRLNNSIDNLIIIDRSNHNKLHKFGKKRPDMIHNDFYKLVKNHRNQYTINNQTK